ncbi:MAG TPA: hypothetical protein VK978_04395 [Candidatus Saccharimonadales bacterium]|nr:hypothetical protein [Candidatus Saccharimonadales bacterium]
MYAVILHAHQKIDRIAHRHLQRLLGKDTFFPRLQLIYHFEGNNGPDATKLKNKHNVEQPWHFIDPFNIEDTDLHRYIEDHYAALVRALREKDEVRSAFEASWLAHALVDGLTPAHHYPYEKELEDLRGDSRHSRKGLVGRAIIKGDNRRDSFKRSFQLIGPKGLLTTHALFEGGAYTIMAPLKLTSALPTTADIAEINKHGLVAYFQRMAKEVAVLDMYERFYQKGWTQKLSRDIRKELAPRMVKMVTLAWYAAVQEATVDEGRKKPVSA